MNRRQYPETIYCRIFGQFEFNLALSALIRNAMFMPPHTISLQPQYLRCLKNFIAFIGFRCTKDLRSFVGDPSGPPYIFL